MVWRVLKPAIDTGTENRHEGQVYVCQRKKAFVVIRKIYSHIF